MIQDIFLLWLAIAMVLVATFPRPKSWAEQAGERFRDWIDERNGWK